jgi:hypothetical protein
MFTKTLLLASAVAGATAEKAAIPSVADLAQAKNAKTKTVDTTSHVGTSAAVTSGGYAYASVQSCTAPISEPIVYGYNLNECVTTTSSSSYKETQCEFNGSNDLVITRTTYTNSDCTGTGTVSTYNQNLYGSSMSATYCDSTYNYQYYCGTDVGYPKFGSPQHYGWFDNSGCSGAEYEWWIISYSSCTDDSGCSSISSYDSGKGICDDPDDTCFHVDTKIDYKGVEYTYEELKAGKEPECTVPHSPASKGVVITTSCDKTVRVTDTHLMATTKGFQLAYSLKAGDVLYGDYGKDMCTVKAVEKEKTTQQYFGLNCVHSEVLASGLRASTFGDFHTLPSWYMTYVGGLIGSDTASHLGEYIAEWYFQK